MRRDTSCCKCSCWREKRSKGYGKQLLLFVETVANENNAACIALESGLQRLEAHRFYEEVIIHLEKGSKILLNKGTL